MMFSLSCQYYHNINIIIHHSTSSNIYIYIYISTTTIYTLITK